MADQNDVEQNIQLARRLAEFGEEVKIRPHLEGGSNPELQLGSLLGDFKRYDPKRAPLKKFVKNSIATANKQGANIPVMVIEDKHYNKQDVLNSLKGNLKADNEKKNITHVWLLMDKELIAIKRADAVTGKIETILP